MKHKLLFRRFFASLLLLAVSTLSWAYDFEVNGIYYSWNSDGTSVSVTYKNTYYNSYSGSVKIPATVTYDSKNYGVTSIGESAFENCSGLTSITIPNSVTSIASRAFYNCSGLTSVTINSNAILSKNYIYGNHLKDIFGEQVTEYIIGNSVTSIGSYAFYYCSGLTSVTIGDNVTSIGPCAFAYCSGLTSVTIPESVTSIGGGAFYGCSGLTSVTIPESVTSIGNYAFYGCSGLTSITIPNSVTSIGNDAFSDCSGLTSITIPNSVTSIGDRAFYGCSGLTSISVASNNSTYDSRKNCNAIIETATNTLVVGCKETIIPNSVTSIGKYAFYNCSGLTSISIPNSVTSIGSGAFAYCSGLTSIIVVSGNPRYDSRNNCNAIIETATNTLVYGCKDTFIPEDVTSIADGAFYGCSGLTSITIPNSVTSIGGESFLGCSGLTSISVDANNSVYDSRDNCNAIINTTTNTLFIGCKSSVIPESVTSIGGRAFFNCSGLTSITIPNSVKSIGNSVFSGCSGLTSVSIGNGVTSIGEDAFYGCKFRTIVSKAVNPANYSLESVGFTDATYLHTPLYVPENSFWNYVYGTEWYRFNIIKEYAATEVEARQAYMLADTDGTNFTVYNAASDKLVTKEYMHQVDETSLGSNWVAEPCGAGVALLNLGAEKYAQISNDGKISLSDTPQELDIEFNDGVATANGRQMMLVLNDDDDITDVVTLRYTPSASEDSFDPNAPIYDLMGRRLTEKPASGYYIQGGKKYLAQ